MPEPSIAVRLARLADHPQFQDELRRWFETEWAHYYGAQGPGDAAADIAAFSRREGLPLGVIALHGDELCGIAALKADPFPTHPQLMPWASAGLVKPALRRQGIGALLIRQLVAEAARQGHARIYCATATAHGLLQRGGWQRLDSVSRDGAVLGIYMRSTAA